MPLVRIDLIEGRPVAELRAIADGVQQALVDTMNVPAADRFQIVSEHRAELFHYDRGYLDSDRSDAVVVVHVTLSAGRSTDAKQRFYRRLSDLLAEAVGLRREDLVVALTENGREDWSFGDGAASYLVIPPERWR